MKRGMTVLTPANDWREALPVGDGSLSAMVYGSITPETVMFNHDMLWYGGETIDLPDFSSEFEKMRELGYAGKMQEANDYIPDLMRKNNVFGGQHTYHPAFDMKIKSEQKIGFSNYRRYLDFSKGETLVTWNDGDVRYERRFFISRVKHIGAFKFTAGGNLLDAAFQLCEHNLYDSLDHGGGNHDVLKELFQFETRFEGDKLYINVKGSYGGDYGAVLKIFPGEGTIKCGNETTWTQQMSSLPMLWGLDLEKRASIYVTGSKNVTATIAMYVRTSDAAAEQKKLADMLDSIGGDYDALLAEHIALHGEIFDRLALDLTTEHMYEGEDSNDMLLLDAYQGKASGNLIVKMFDYGRYLLMTSSNESGLPPTLQGNHNGDYFPAWQSFYVHNENTQMFYWQALNGRMPEVMGAMFKFFEDRMDDFKKNARNLFNCRGIFIPLVTDEHHGLMNIPAPHEISFTGVAPWLAAHFYDYYLFTGDKKFLEERALPFMEEVALFYEDFLILDKDGMYTVFPSNSPENAPRNSFPEDTDLSIVMNPGIPTTFNSTIDMALVRESFTNIINAYKTLGIKEDKQAQYAEMLTKLRPFRINEDGALAEWIPEDHLDNYAHRHLSHIYPLFPGFQITEEDNKELFESVRKAVEKRLEFGLTAQTGWSLVHLANIYARLHDGESCARCFDLHTRTCVGRNLFAYHNDYRNMGVSLMIIFGRSNPYQIDSNMGFTASIIEMLLSSDTSNNVRIAQALPKEWKAGKIEKVATRCGCDCTVSWADGKIETVIEARDTRKIHVILPYEYKYNGAKEFDLDIEAGKTYTITATK